MRTGRLPSSSSSTCRASRSTSSAAGRRSRRRGGCSDGRRRSSCATASPRRCEWIEAETIGEQPMSVRRALITGITGQDGSYLAELLLEQGYEVHGMVRRSSTEKFDRIEHIRDRITLHQGDLLDHRSLVDALRASNPHEIYNLAAMSYVAASWIQPTLTAEFTGTGVTRLLEAMREVCPEARFYQASSSEMFGKVLEVPQTEKTPFYPRSPYGVAKVYGHFITVNYRESYGLHATQRDPLQPRIAPARARVRHPQDHLARGGDQARAGCEAAPRQPRRRARLGLRRGLRPRDVADAPAGRAAGLRDRHRDRPLGPRVRRDRLRPRRPGDRRPRRDRSRRCCGRPRSSTWSATRARPAGSSAGSRRSASSSWCG